MGLLHGIGQEANVRHLDKLPVELGLFFGPKHLEEA
jgi:hypothetical protein